MPALSEQEYGPTAAAVRRRWRLFAAHAFLDSVTPPRRTLDPQYADLTLLAECVMNGADLIVNLAADRAMAATAFATLVQRCERRFYDVLHHDPCVAAEFDASVAAIARAIQTPERRTTA